MGVEQRNISVRDMLKNALQWKQWMVDDLRLLIHLSETGDIDSDSLHALMTHHLQTYELVNQTYTFLTDDDEDKLFDLPNIEELKRILPTLDLTKDSKEDIIEPMLELELDDLSGDLHAEAKQDSFVEEPLAVTDVEVEDDEDEEDEPAADDVDEYEIFVDDLELDEPIESVEFEKEQDLDSTNIKTGVTTTDIVGKLWDNMSQSALVNNEVGEGDVEIDEGSNE